MDTNDNHTLLICTVGGTPEPLVKSLLHWRPARVLFVPSQQTRSHVDAALLKYAEHARQPLAPGCYDIHAVNDAEDLHGCLRVIRSLDQQVQDWLHRGGDFDVVADFTAGTKCMAAALALQARRWRCAFSYVGGTRRTKEGVGTVESGSERVVHSANPWDALGYQAVEDAVTVFNHGGYAAAAALLCRARESANDPPVKRELSTAKAVIDAYAAWDRFDHDAARRRFDDALKNRNDLTAVFADAQTLITRLEHHREQVAQLAKQNDPTRDWIKDLLGNARRRADEGRFDDSVARLYRAIEAMAQVRLAEKHKVPNTEQVPLAALPEPLKTEWASRACDDAVRLALQDDYQLLSTLGDELGRKFQEHRLDDRKRSPLVGRNQSILAHGFDPVGEKITRKLQKAALELSGFRKYDLPTFPTLGISPSPASVT